MCGSESGDAYISRVPQSFRELKSVGKNAGGCTSTGGRDWDERETGEERKNDILFTRRLVAAVFVLFSFPHAFYIPKRNIPPTLCLAKLADFIM